MTEKLRPGIADFYFPPDLMAGQILPPEAQAKAAAEYRAAVEKRRRYMGQALRAMQRHLIPPTDTCTCCDDDD